VRTAFRVAPLLDARGRPLAAVADPFRRVFLFGGPEPPQFALRRALLAQDRGKPLVRCGGEALKLVTRLCGGLERGLERVARRHGGADVLLRGGGIRDEGGGTEATGQQRHGRRTPAQ